MKLRNVDVTDAISKARQHADTASLSGETRLILNLLITIIELFTNAFGANSRNSSKPPSQDPNRKKSQTSGGKKKIGGQKGHIGTTLKQVSSPDEVVRVEIDPLKLPKDSTFAEAEPIRRQVFDVKINVVVTEFQAQVLVDSNGNRYVASFPVGVDAPVQYGPGVRGQVVYMSNFQFIPAERICDQFAHLYGLPMSAGTVVNINAEAARLLALFDKAAKNSLIASEVLHADETGVNIGGKTIWLHSASNELWTLFTVHTKRGNEGMESAGILPEYKGILVHDNWQPYFKYHCQHALCNAHHIRELTRAFEDDGQKWAKDMLDLLTAINEEVKATTTGCLSIERVDALEKEYDAILNRGDVECPLPDEPTNVEKKRGRQKKSRPRNLLERLRDRKQATLRFMREPLAPFTNNQGERDIRMTKVQQKVSGCFRSLDGAQNFCIIRSFISSCIKHGANAADALTDLFKGKLPEFVNQALHPPPE